jgi:DNA helicase-4
MMVRVWQEYESLLKQNDMIDFNDMISLALQAVKQQNGQLTKRYSHILIDEFQDITDPQLELIKGLLAGNENNSLFCVGDYRQNIFSFAGSNIYNILNFDKQFPYAERTTLSTNYRCPKNVVAVSNDIANMNKSNIESNIVSASAIEHPIFLMQMSENEIQNYDDWELHRAVELLKQLIHDRKPDEQILVLARTNNRLRRLEIEFPRHETQELRFLTIHRAKGTEADYVLLLGCVGGKYGFPIETTNQRILDIVKSDLEDKMDEKEEERRLFYVAITRCKKQLYLFTAKGNKSLFVSEIESYLVAK